MKLLDLIVELENEKYQTDLPAEGGMLTLNSIDLKKLENRLFRCSEFDNVARLNFIDLPTYLVDEETQEPIASNRNFLGGKTKVKQVCSNIFAPSRELKFNKIVDLYSISLHKKYTLSTDIVKPGIWVYPTQYDADTFSPLNQIRVIWDPAQLNEALTIVSSSESPKQRLLRMFETALESMEANIPCEYFLNIRCSSRSLNIEEDKTMQCAYENSTGPEIPTSSMSLSGSIGMVGSTVITGATEVYSFGFKM